MNPSAALIRGSILLLFLQVAQCFKKGGFQPQRRVYTMTSNENYMPAEQWLKQGLASAMLAGFLGMQIAGPANAIISLPPVPMVKEMERAAVNQLLSEEELALQESGNFILPFYKEKDYDTTRIVTDNQLQDAKKRIQALQPYLDEIERYLFAEEYRYLGGFFGVFAEQEDALVALIDGLFPSARWRTPRRARPWSTRRGPCSWRWRTCGRPPRTGRRRRPRAASWPSPRPTTASLRLAILLLTQIPWYQQNLCTHSMTFWILMKKLDPSHKTR
ncbi:unnamed protein product [Heterosigma akashiwo]